MREWICVVVFVLVHGHIEILNKIIERFVFDINEIDTD